MDEKYISGFGERLKTAIRKSGYTQKAFAEKVNISETGLINYIKGRRFPDVPLLDRIARLSNESFLWLIRGDEKDKGLVIIPREATKMAQAIERAKKSEAYSDDDEKQKLRAENESLRERVAKLEKSLIALASGESQVDAIMLAEIVARSRELTDRLEKLIIEKGG